MTESSIPLPIWKDLFRDGKLQTIESTYMKLLTDIDIDQDYFHSDFPDTFEYKFFFLNALKGFLQSKQFKSNVTSEGKKIKFEIDPEDAEKITVLQPDWLRMDLIARLAGRVAEAIKLIEGKKVTIVTNRDSANEGNNDQLNLLFVTADFVKAVWNQDDGYVKLDQKKRWIESTKSENATRHYKFEHDDANKIKLDFFGWRPNDPLTYDNEPISNKENEKIATYLCFPAFFQFDSVGTASFGPLC